MAKKRTPKNNLFKSWSFEKINYQIFSIGIILILIGYIIMISGSTTSIVSTKVSPVILVIGYCVIIPLSILFKKNK